MAQYGTNAEDGKTTTATFTNGATGVEGVGGTEWDDFVTAGDMILVEGEGVPYTLASVTDADTLVLTANYGGITGTKDYIIVKDFTSNYVLPLIAKGHLDWPDIMNEAISLIDTNMKRPQRVAVTSGPYTMLITDEYIGCDPSSGAFEIDLIAAATAGDGKVVIIKNETASSNVITIDGNASETIDGSTTKTIAAGYGYMHIRCDGSNWFIIG